MQPLHSTAPASEDFPRAQLEHVALLSEAEYVPTAHGEHWLLPVEENFPAEQALQEAAPALE